MVELSIEVIEGLREPLIGLRCWISRCTFTKHFQLKGFKIDRKTAPEGEFLLYISTTILLTSLLYSCRLAKWAKVIWIGIYEPYMTELKTSNVHSVKSVALKKAT